MKTSFFPFSTVSIFFLRLGVVVNNVRVSGETDWKEGGGEVTTKGRWVGLTWKMRLRGVLCLHHSSVRPRAPFTSWYTSKYFLYRSPYYSVEKDYVPHSGSGPRVGRRSSGPYQRQWGPFRDVWDGRKVHEVLCSGIPTSSCLSSSTDTIPIPPPFVSRPLKMFIGECYERGNEEKSKHRYLSLRVSYHTIEVPDTVTSHSRNLWLPQFSWTNRWSSTYSRPYLPYIDPLKGFGYAPTHSPSDDICLHVHTYLGLFSYPPLSVPCRLVGLLYTSRPTRRWNPLVIETEPLSRPTRPLVNLTRKLKNV